MYRFSHVRGNDNFLVMKPNHQTPVTNHPVSEADARWMRKALEQAREAQAAGEVPVGAVLVRNDELVAQAWNRPISTNDPCAHAEVLAIRAGAARIGNYRLPDCSLYVTLEPCAMCAGAIIQARLKRVVYGAADPKTGAAGSVFEILGTRQLNHYVEVEGGVLVEACGNLLSDFFKQRRKAQ